MERKTEGNGPTNQISGITFEENRTFPYPNVVVVGFFFLPPPPLLLLLLFLLLLLLLLSSAEKIEAVVKARVAKVSRILQTSSSSEEALLTLENVFRNF